MLHRYLYRNRVFLTFGLILFRLATIKRNCNIVSQNYKCDVSLFQHLCVMTNVDGFQYLSIYLN